MNPPLHDVQIGSSLRMCTTRFDAGYCFDCSDCLAHSKPFHRGIGSDALRKLFVGQLYRIPAFA
jgi:hypothetical protein